jgi:signal transduction histidine kinase
MKFTLHGCCCIVLLLWSICPEYAGAQPLPIDSLRTALERPKTVDTAFTNLLNNLSFAYNAYLADSAMVYGKQALVAAEKANYKKGIGDACRNIGFAYQRLGKLADATGYYLRAVPLFEGLNDSLGLANVWNGLGICYFEQGDFGNALQFYQRAEPMFLHLGKMDRYAASMSNIGYAYLQMGNLNLAQAYSKKALALANQYNVSTIQTFALSHLGDIARRKGDYATAEDYFHKALTVVARYPENAVSNSRFYNLLGYFYTDYLDSSLAVSLRANMRFRMKDAYQGYQHLYATMKNFEQAYRYQSLVALYQDSLFNQESARQIATMQRELESREQMAQISLLTKDSEIQQTTRNALLGGIAVVILAGLLLWRSYLQMRSVNRQLQSQNVEILEQRSMMERQSEEIATINSELQQKNQHLVNLNEEKSQFMRIAAHDLKNPLTSIRGLSEFLAIDAPNLPTEEVALISNRVAETADRMFQLVKSLLDVNAIEDGSIALHTANFNVALVLETAVQNYVEAAKAKNIRLLLTTTAQSESLEQIIETEFVAFADAQLTAQVMDNLLSNAVKYSPMGKSVIVRLFRESVENFGTTKRVSEYIRLEVQDEGQGLTEQDKTLLFGKFTKLSARPTAGEDSTGLGKFGASLNMGKERYSLFGCPLRKFCDFLLLHCLYLPHSARRFHVHSPLSYSSPICLWSRIPACSSCTNTLNGATRRAGNNANF